MVLEARRIEVAGEADAQPGRHRSMAQQAAGQKGEVPAGPQEPLRPGTFDREVFGAGIGDPLQDLGDATDAPVLLPLRGQRRIRFGRIVDVRHDVPDPAAEAGPIGGRGLVEPGKVLRIGMAGMRGVEGPNRIGHGGLPVLQGAGL